MAIMLILMCITFEGRHDMSIAKIQEAFNAVDVTSTEKFVLVALAYHHNGETGRCFPSYETLVEDTKLNRSTIIRAIKSLNRRGHITVEHRRRRLSKKPQLGPDTSNEYTLPIVTTADSVENPKKHSLIPLGVAQCDPIGNLYKEQDIERLEKLEKLEKGFTFLVKSTKAEGKKGEGKKGKKEIGKSGNGNIKEGKVAPAEIEYTTNIPPSQKYVAEHKNLTDTEFVETALHDFTEQTHKVFILFWFVLLTRFYPEQYAQVSLLGKKEHEALKALRKLMKAGFKVEAEHKLFDFTLFDVMAAAVQHWFRVTTTAEKQYHANSYVIPANGPTLTFINQYFEAVIQTIPTVAQKQKLLAKEATKKEATKEVDKQAKDLQATEAYLNSIGIAVQLYDLTVAKMDSGYGAHKLTSSELLLKQYSSELEEAIANGAPPPPGA